VPFFTRLRFEAKMYFLSKDCFACKTQGYWIVLNATRDKYLCVTNDDLASIGGRLHGWRGRRSSASTRGEPDIEADMLIASLLSSGIITGNSVDGKPFVESECPMRGSEIPPARSERRMREKWSLLRAARFFIACLKADWNLRVRRFSRVVENIERRRSRAPSYGCVPDIDSQAALIVCFKKLRPLYPRPYLCLFDSLALFEYLAISGSCPQFVFGVVADPFQAHCWLQNDTVVLNDDLERVGKYTPILCI
jgi:Transglutaminase-like superfamily